MRSGAFSVGSVSILLVVMLSLAACGYRLGETKSTWARAGKTLSIGRFENATAEFGAEVALAEAAARVFAARGGFALDATGNGDFVLRARLASLESALGARRFEGDGASAQSEELNGVVEVWLVDRAHTELWRTRIAERVDYAGSAAYGRVRVNRDEAYARFAERVMKRAYEELAEGF
ncbi:MAG: hypothetical protein C4523_20420 [Myxococcales bacterium]|nr:MAG: hypothetical protein C4523_20420 [Myxococcales bacterium]